MGIKFCLICLQRSGRLPMDIYSSSYYFVPNVKELISMILPHADREHRFRPGQMKEPELMQFLSVLAVPMPRLASLDLSFLAYLSQLQRLGPSPSSSSFPCSAVSLKLYYAEDFPIIDILLDMLAAKPELQILTLELDSDFAGPSQRFSESVRVIWLPQLKRVSLDGNLISILSLLAHLAIPAAAVLDIVVVISGELPFFDPIGETFPRDTSHQENLEPYATLTNLRERGPFLSSLPMSSYAHKIDV
ncbi:hypothetical protein BKA93DRAFT_822121 [Sparassis latifolia]